LFNRWGLALQPLCDPDSHFDEIEIRLPLSIAIL
jgi:hypothetical protein